MASQIRRLITSNVTRSVVVSSFRPRIFAPELFNGTRRSFSSTTTGEFDYNKLEPIPGSLRISFVKGEDVKIKLPGLEKTETDTDLCVFLKMPGVKKLGDVEVTFNYNHSVLAITTNFSLEDVSYHGSMKFPYNVNKNCVYNREMIKDGLFKITLPKLNLEDLNIFSKAIVNYRYMSMLIFNICLPPTLYYVMKAISRSNFLFKKFCPKTFHSFTCYNKLTPQSLNIRFTLPLSKEMLSVVEEQEDAICVSLNMPELQMQDVKLYLKHGALYIEGKTKNKTDRVHYVKAIRLPNTLLQNLQTSVEMQEDGMYKATLSPVNREEIRLFAKEPPLKP